MVDVSELLKSALADRYRIERELGRGGMATVYLAEDLKHHRSVALKVLDPEVARALGPERFLREIEIAARLEHPHILPMFDSGQAGDLLYYVMPYVEGQSLRERLEREPQLPIEEVQRLAGEMANALAFAHARDIVHRDIKPENILLQDGQALLADFGIARAVSTAGSEKLTQTGVTVGTPAYMSPEQSAGTATVDARSDQYALACLVYEMLAGQPPFTGPTAESIAHQHLAVLPRPVSDLRTTVPRAMVEALTRALAKSPADRFAGVADFARGLMTPRPRMPDGVRSAAFVTSGVVVVLVALLAMNAGGWRDRLLGKMSGTAIASVVALPSQVFADEQDAFLADAIPNTISSHLNQIAGLETKVPPKSVEFEKVGGDLGRIAKAYGVDALVMSTVTAQAENLSLNLQLVEAGTRRLVWSRDFDGERSDYLQLVHQAAEGLRKALRPAASSVSPMEGDSQAEILFQRGLYHSNRYNNLHREVDFDKALGAFEQVWQLDSTRAEAAAETGWLYWFKAEVSGFPAKTLGIADNWAQRAIETDSRCGRAWALRASTIGFFGDWEESLRASLRAAFLSPRDALATTVLGFGLTNGSRQLALDSFLLASRLDPLYTYASGNASEQMALLERGTESLELSDQTLALEPDGPFHLMGRALVLIMLDRGQEAAAMLLKLERAVADDRLPQEAYQAIQDLLIVRTADEPEWRPAVDRLLAWENAFLFSGWDFLALILARRGATADALEALEHTGSIDRVPPYDWLMLSPSLHGLRGEPRFERVAARSRAQFQRTLSILEEARERGELPQYLDASLAELLADLETTSAR